jgi:hypothetical protein
MGFWDFTDPYEWLRQNLSTERVSGSPHATRKGLSRGDDRGPFGALAEILDTQFDPYGRRIPGQPQADPYGVIKTNRKNISRNIADQVSMSRNRPPTTAELLAELGGLQDPSRYLQDQDSLSSQAMQMASAQYDPLIAQIEAQMGSARNRAGRNQAEVGRMFNALSSNLQGDVPGIQQEYAEDKAQSQQAFDQLQQQTKDQYAATQADQEAMMQRLNIEAAAPDALAGQQRDKDFFTQLAARDAATEQSALGKEERGAVNYTQQGSQIARAEGTQRQADIMSQLSDLLSQYEGQIGAQRAAKRSSYLATLGQLQGDQQESAMSNAQRDFDNYIKMIQLGRGLDKDSATGQVSVVKSPADVANRALGMGLNQSGAQSVQDVFMSAISSDPQILAGTSVFGQSVPKEAMAQRVVEAGRKAGMNRQQLNVLQTVALEYFGRR